ncbi:hypothetical protein BGX38DRAFT_1141491 [Terfezia claveryi]|nr:hypothetical protein BGX38DRAFT_1141491 [Terfezia claveryi]
MSLIVMRLLFSLCYEFLKLLNEHPGVAESAEAWSKFNEDAVIYNRNPSIFPVSTIIQAGIPHRMQPPITDSEATSEILPVDEPIPPNVPADSEAIPQSDDPATFFFPLFPAPN